MSKILDLAKNFNETSKEEAKSINRALASDLKQLESDLNKALQGSKQNLVNAILDNQQAFKRELYENQRRMSWALFRSWLWLIGFLLILCLGLTVWNIWQGIEIYDQSQKISLGKQALQDLPEGIEVAKEKGITYLIQSEKIKTKPEVYQTKSGQWVMKIGK